MAAKRLSAGQLRLWLTLGLGMFALYVGFAAALDKLLPRWEGVWDYSHGYLVLCMVIWLLLERVRQQPTGIFVPSPIGLFVLAVFVGLYTVMQLVDLTNGMFAILLLVLLGVLWAFGGAKLLRIGAFPILLLVFAIPFWDRLGPVLQDIATIVVRNMLRAAGIAAFSEGHVIRTARAAVEVAAACSGMTFLLASLTLTSFYTMAWIRSWWYGVLLASVGVVLAIVSNWLRIFIITIAGHFSDMEHYLIVEDHELFGWALFSVFMVGLIVYARRLELRSPTLTARSAVDGEVELHSDTNARLAAFGSEPTEDAATADWSARSYVIVGLALVLLVLPILVRPEFVMPRVAVEMSLDPRPDSAWQRSVGVGTWLPESPNPAGVLRQTYARAGVDVDAYAAYYPIQSPGGKVTSTAHRLTADWRVVSDRQLSRAGWVVREQKAVRGDQARLIWSWFSVAGNRVPNLYQAKLHEVLGILKGNRAGAVFAVSTACLDICVDARRHLEDFLTNSGEALHQLSDTKPVREL